TQDVVHFGKRSTVDQTLKRCVDKGHIRRLARGVFMRIHWRGRDISNEEIARIKAEAFGKSFHVKDGTFRVSGRSSTFMFGEMKIQLKQTRRRARVENVSAESVCFVREFLRLLKTACRVAQRHLR